MNARMLGVTLRSQVVMQTRADAFKILFVKTLGYKLSVDVLKGGCFARLPICQRALHAGLMEVT